MLLHRGVETVVCDADTLAKDGCLKGLGCQVALHLTQILFAQELQILNGAVLFVVHRH